MSVISFQQRSHQQTSASLSDHIAMSEQKAIVFLLLKVSDLNLI